MFRRRLGDMQHHGKECEKRFRSIYPKRGNIANPSQENFIFTYCEPLVWWRGDLPWGPQGSLSQAPEAKDYSTRQKNFSFSGKNVAC